MSKKIVIVMLTCNQKELLKKCLISLRKNTKYKNYKVYVIDDSGIKGNSSDVKKSFKWASFYENKENIGCAKSINFGMKKALEDSADYILLLNDDMEFIEEDWLEKMIQVGESDEKIGILGCKLIYPKGELQWFFKNNKLNFEKIPKKIIETKETFSIKKVPDIIGACFLIKKEVVKKIGFFDEKFSPIYGDETDYCYRAKYAGFKLFYVGNTKVIHVGSASVKKTERFGGKWFLQKRHSIRLEWLNFNFPKILQYTIIHFGSAILSKNPLKGLKLLLKAYKENIKDFNEIKIKRKQRLSKSN